MYQLISKSAHDTGLGDESVQCIVTSPPYWALRKYAGEQSMEWPSVSYSPMPGLPELHIEPMTCELGLEPTPEMWVGHMVLVMREMWRVLRDDGTCWVNLGDSFQDKQLIGMPWRLAFALQADGWWLRSDIIWHKTNPIPESVKDRPTKGHEYLFLLTKQPRYFYDADAVREPHKDYERGNNPQELKGHCGLTGGIISGTREAMKGMDSDGAKRVYNPAGRNRRTVWTISTQPNKAAHFATFPEKLVEPCVKAGTSEHGCCPECQAPWERVVESELVPQYESRHGEYNARGNPDGMVDHSGDWKPGTKHVTTTGWQPTCSCFGEFASSAILQPCTVLDPFSGSGTTGKVALENGRSYIGIDISDEYNEELARKRLDSVQVRLI
jgi:DNA modification methylase